MSKQLIKEGDVQLLCRLSLGDTSYIVFGTGGTTLSSNRIDSCCLQNLLMALFTYSCLHREDPKSIPDHLIMYDNKEFSTTCAIRRIMSCGRNSLQSTSRSSQRPPWDNLSSMMAGFSPYSVSYKVHHETFFSSNNLR